MGDKRAMKPYETLPILVLNDTIIFPGTSLTFTVTEPEQLKFFNELEIKGGEEIACGYSLSFGQKQIEGSPKIYKAATKCVIGAFQKTNKGYVVRLLGIKRLEHESWGKTKPILTANFSEPETVTKQDDLTLAGLMMALNDQARKILPKLTDDGQNILGQFEAITSASEKIDFLVFYLVGDNKDDYALSIRHLAEKNLCARVKETLMLLSRKSQLTEINKKLADAVQKEQHSNADLYQKHQRKEAIIKELAELENEKAKKNGGAAAETFEERIQKRLAELKAAVTADPNVIEAHKTIEKEFKRYLQMNPASAEANVARDHLDWLINMPWFEATDDVEDIVQARKILDSDHYGMQKIKKRILEYLAVRKLSPNKKAPILCFVGPPGVGKTSIGKSLARAMGRKFYRQSLGGVGDEAAIRGHRRTYVGALPGRIVQMVKHVGVNNPVLMLDEIDKLTRDQRGDPASALLEALDPEQNHSFSDHYIAIPFNLSNVVFICTANQKETIPPALFDRMEVIELPGYTPTEKFQIADKFLIPKQLQEHGFETTAVRIDKENVLRIVEGYTRESGVRNLEREIGSIVRSVAVKLVEEKPWNTDVSAADIVEYLGPQKYEPELAGEEDAIGVSTGMYYSPAGGGILPIEALLVPYGSGQIKITGNLVSPSEFGGDPKLVNSMLESVRVALGYIKSHAGNSLPADFFERHDIHIHFPDGATPKDGPSAGLAITTALTSLVTDKPVRHLVAMTGEIDLVGRALPIGGLKEKILGAHRAGIKKILIPIANKKDLVDIPDEIKNDLEIIPVSNISEVLTHALVG